MAADRCDGIGVGCPEGRSRGGMVWLITPNALYAPKSSGRRIRGVIAERSIQTWGLSEACHASFFRRIPSTNPALTFFSGPLADVHQLPLFSSRSFDDTQLAWHGTPYCPVIRFIAGAGAKETSRYQSTHPPLLQIPGRQALENSRSHAGPWFVRFPRCLAKSSRMER